MQKLQCLFVICVEAIIYMFLYNLHDCTFDPIQDWLFWGCSRMGGGGQKSSPSQNLSHISYNDETWHSYTLPKVDRNNTSNT